MGRSGKALCVIGRFEPFGRQAEVALAAADVQGDAGNDSYFLFNPEVARVGSTGVEQAVLSSCCSDHDEEIFIQDNVIVWSAGHQIRKRFSAPSTVLKACWCSMESIKEPLLCVLHSNSLSTYTPSGEMNSVPLPYAMLSMWPLPCGLLLQRATDAGAYAAALSASSPTSRCRELPKTGKLTPSLRRTSVSPAPVASASVYFTLQHHLEEPEGLEFEESGRLRVMTDSDEQIIWTSRNVPYVASYHIGRKQHSLWEIKSMQSPIKSVLQNDKGKELLGTICLRKRWQEKGGQPQATQVFKATDEDGEPLLCFVVKQNKKLFSLRLSSAPSEAVMDIAWTISAVSAVPVVASRPKLKRNGCQHFDLLVLAPDGNIFLYTGRYPLCTYYLPVLVEQFNSNQPAVVQLMDAVKDRVNVATSSGQIYRCAVLLTPSSGITKSCLSALAEGLRPSFYRYLLSSLFACGSGDLNRTDSNPDTEWSAFSRIVMQWVGERKTDSQLQHSASCWEFLQQSSMHKNTLLSCCYPALALNRDVDQAKAFSSSEKSKAEPSGYTSMLVEILETLHMVYEDYKLDTLRRRDLWKLGVLLSNVAVAVEEYDYADHYGRDFLTVVPSWQLLPKHSGGSSPPNHYTWIESVLTRKTAHHYLPSLLTTEGNNSVDWSRKVLGFFDLLLGSDISGKRLPSGINLKISTGTANSAEQRTVLAMVAEGFGLSDLDRLPCGVSLPLRHALNNCRESPPTDWPSEAYILVGREDLAYTSAGRRSSRKSFRTSDVMMAAPYMLHLRPTLPSTDTHEPYNADGQSESSIVGQLSDGMDHMFTASTKLRFGCDLRLNEVRRFLCSSRPVAVRTANAPDVSDPDLVAQQQAQLWQLAQRTTALPFGRGAFTLSTLRPLLTEALPIPKLVLAGRLPSQHDATINLDVNAGNITDLTLWPEFHNGVAAGLRLAPGQAKITRTWIVYNKPDEPSYEHAGFLMSLGLHKHLAVLAATDVFRYLAQEHDPTTVGILLGMAAAHRGTMDPAISKMLYLHIPARHPPSFPELELSSLLQSAALMAVGLLYQGSAHRLTTEILLAEIGRKPGSDSSLDREGYALAAGLALGLVTLGRGKDAWGLADLLIEDRLRHYMCGGSEPSDDHRRRFDGTSSFSGFSFLSKSYEDPSQTGGQVMEGSIVNLDVTAPGATLALALMFMKTNDEAVAARLAIPDTHYALEYVRPDFILLRLVARSLILWDSVQATENWVQSQLPDIVREAMASSNLQGKGALEGLADADMEALAQAHVNILAGACLSIGLRYAGTANAEAQQLLYHYALFFFKEKSVAVSGGGSTPNDHRAFVDRGTLETCLDVAVLSLSVVMAGTGHLETFKLLRYLRRRTDSDGSIVYGNHMAISMAIGFLFHGGGSLTFSTNDGAVAALLISLYPRFPTTPNDHRCHLQAFRHLYVLATEARCIQTVDVDTGLLVYAPLEMTLRETNFYCETSFCRVSPCILPERASLKRVRVCGPRYWPQDILLSSGGPKSWWEHGEEGDAFNGGVLYVKRKVGARSYADDPIGSRSLLSRALHRVSHVNKESVNANIHLTDQSKVDQLVSTFSSDPSLLAFAQLFCNLSQSSSSDGEFEDFCLLALFECVSMDRPALLQTYFALYTSVEGFVSNATGRGSNASSLFSTSLSLQSLKVALAYCEAAGHGPEAALKGQSLIQRTFLAALSKRIDDVLSHWQLSGQDEQVLSMAPPFQLVAYLSCHSRDGVLPKSSANDKNSLQQLMFACYVVWNAVPQPSLINAALQKIYQVFPDSSSGDVNMLLPMLASLLPGTPPKTLLQITQCVPLLEEL